MPEINWNVIAIVVFDAITKIALIVCTTFAAVRFNNYWLLFFFVLALGVGNRVKVIEKEEEDNEECGNDAKA